MKMLGTVFTVLSIGGSAAAAVGTVGGKLYSQHKQNVEFENRMNAMENEFHSRFDDCGKIDDSLNMIEGIDPQ